MTPPKNTRLETEYLAATLRIDNDLLTIAALTTERDAYAKAADTMAASHKVERDDLKNEIAGWRAAQKENLKNQCELFGQIQQALVERDEYREKYNSTYSALDDCARLHMSVADERDALKDAARLALDALEYASTGNRRPEVIGPAINALKAVLK